MHSARAAESSPESSTALVCAVELTDMEASPRRLWPDHWGNIRRGIRRTIGVSTSSLEGDISTQKTCKPHGLTGLATRALWVLRHRTLRRFHLVLVVVVVIIVLQLMLLAAPVLFFGGHGATLSCATAEQTIALRGIMSSSLLCGLVAVWMLRVATTPYLQQVAHYTVWLWFYSWASSFQWFGICTAPDTKGSNDTLCQLTGICVIISSVITILLCFSIVLERIATLERSLQTNLHSSLLRWMGVFIGISGGLAKDVFSGTFGDTPFKIVMIFAGLYLAALVFAMGAGLPLAKRAASTATGRRRYEAEHAARVATIQLAGVFVTLLSTFVFYIDEVFGSEFSGDILRIVDVSINAFGAVMLSGATSGSSQGREMQRQAEWSRVSRWRQRALSWLPESQDDSWNVKVEDLAGRGFSLAALMRFYRVELPNCMPDFSPTTHTTSDVVRRAIIPLSAPQQTAYACVMMDGVHTKPMKMVTHNWRNLFRDLVAAIVADALDEDEYEMISNMLDRDAATIEEWLSRKNVLMNTYWVCAFSVSQHDGICGANPFDDRDPITGKPHPACPCGKQKFFNTTEPTFEGRSVLCEMNKFDDMMDLLSSRDERFGQVIAVDAAFELFTRAWCVAELAKAYEMGMTQHLKLLSGRALDDHAESLRRLRIEEMKASRPEDIEEILSKISDKDRFNEELQHLLFSSMIPNWQNLDACEQVDRMGRIARWQAESERRHSMGIYCYRQDRRSTAES